METITKKAQIIKITEQTLTVKIRSSSACGTCALSGKCGLSECKNLIFEIPYDKSQNFALGQEIDIFIDNKTGSAAVLFAYIIPLILVLTVLLGSAAFNISEILRGIYSIIVLIPYYFALFLLKKSFRHNIKFKISQTNKTE